MERLHKFLSRAGVASRRTAEEWIRAGRVAVNDQVVNGIQKDTGFRVKPEMANDTRLMSRHASFA